MCGIFGIIARENVPLEDLRQLARHAEQRGRDSSGFITSTGTDYSVYRADYSTQRLLRRLDTAGLKLALGHSRLITNGLGDNQPVLKGSVAVLHNGIIVNDGEIWAQIDAKRELEIDTEIIAAIFEAGITKGQEPVEIVSEVNRFCVGVIACAVLLPTLGKLCLFSNNGSLYHARKGGNDYFASESFALNQLQCEDVEQVRAPKLISVPLTSSGFSVKDDRRSRLNLVPAFGRTALGEESILEYKRHELRRCSKCLLPETMPFISFDAAGKCNYCANYKRRNQPRPKEELFELVRPYRRTNGLECVVPFSGGRDSCYGLHLVIKELDLRPVTYTYDWGMVTDLGRRNISRMCGILGVENIIVADDISKKREYIALNLRAWLKAPHLGMVSLLTAGDKHFFRHVETVKRQTGVGLNLWGVNPLEVTHFKAGFLGVPPDFEESRVYSHGALKQLRYHFLRTRAMLMSPGYFNRSLWDTLSGEYYRSFTEKSDYYHIFDFWKWDEKIVDQTLDLYDWERAPDTRTTWRIGDGTAAFYNYVYYTVAGFTEHDTFRSNQIREGEISREEALGLVMDENKPRYQNIKWYLDAIGMDFTDVIRIVNSIPKLYQPIDDIPFR